MDKNILLLYKFKHERSEKFIEDILIPSLSENYTIRKVSSASDVAKSEDYWLKIVHGLMYSSDIVLTIHSQVSNNILLENDGLNRIFLKELPYDAFPIKILEYSKFWLFQLCRPTLIDITLTDRWFRKNKYKVKGKGNYWRLEFNITQSKEFIKDKIIRLIIQVIKYKNKIWNEDYDINQEISLELKEYFINMKHAILESPSIRKSSRLMTKTPVRYIVDEDFKLFYSQINEEGSDVYVILKLILVFMRDFKELKFFNRNYRKKFKKKFKTAIYKTFKSDAESILKGLSIYIPILLLFTIPIVILSIPINYINIILKKL